MGVTVGDDRTSTTAIETGMAVAPSQREKCKMISAMALVQMHRTINAVTSILLVF